MECVSVTRSGALKSYLRLVAELPRLEEPAQEALECRVAAGDRVAARALTESFLAYVVFEASAQRGRGTRFEALIAAGNRGLAVALRQKGGSLRARVRKEVQGSLEEWVRLDDSGGSRL